MSLFTGKLSLAMQIALSAAICAALFLVLLGFNPPGNLWIDFAEYWTSARLLLQGRNPYDPRLVAELQLGLTGGKDAILMWNPPLVFAFTTPLALLDYVSARALWVLLSLAIMGWIAGKEISLNLRTRSVFSSEAGYNLLYAVLFPGFYYCFFYGQIGPLLLLGLWGYWRLVVERDDRGWASFAGGAALSITLIKPQLLYLLYLFILLKIGSRRYALVACGLAVGTVLLSGIAWCMSPEVFNWYFDVISEPPLYWQTPTLGSWMQWATGKHTLLVRSLPALLSVVFLTISMLRGTIRNTPGCQAAIIGAALLCCPFGWTFDQILLFPGMLWALGEIRHHLPGGVRCRLITGAALAANVLVLVLPGEGMQTLVWYPAVNLLLVCLVLRIRREAPTPQA